MAKAEQGSFKTADRQGNLKEIVRSRHALARELETLLIKLEEMHPRPAKPTEERRHTFIVRFSDGRAVFHSPIAGGTDEHALCDQDKALALECLTDADLPTDDTHVESWWVGRLWNGYGDRSVRQSRAALRSKHTMLHR